MRYNKLVMTLGDYQKQLFKEIERLEHRAMSKYLDNVDYEYILEMLAEDDQSRFKRLLRKHKRISSLNLRLGRIFNEVKNGAC